MEREKAAAAARVEAAEAAAGELSTLVAELKEIAGSLMGPRGLSRLYVEAAVTKEEVLQVQLQRRMEMEQLDEGNWRIRVAEEQQREFQLGIPASTWLGELAREEMRKIMIANGQWGGGGRGGRGGGGDCGGGWGGVCVCRRVQWGQEAPGRGVEGSGRRPDGGVVARQRIER